MARDEAPDPKGPEAFDRLKARIGRLPTVDELSRELDTPVPRPARSRYNVDRKRYRRPFTLIGVIGLLLVAIPFFVGRQPALKDGGSPAATAPTLPPAPAIETAAALPALPTVIPPPPPPIAKAPSRRPVPDARAKASSPIQRRVLPNASAGARRTITGRVRINVRVSVDSSGNVTAASPVSPEASAYFTGLAVKAAQEWKFAPAGPDRADAAREWVLRFEFGRQATTATAVPAEP